MKCIDDELIQKYIDSETNSGEAVLIESHAADCPQCARNIETQRAFADYIKREVGQWGRQPDVIPEFVAPATGKRRLKILFRWTSKKKSRKKPSKIIQKEKTL